MKPKIRSCIPSFSLSISDESPSKTEISESRSDTSRRTRSHKPEKKLPAPIIQPIRRGRRSEQISEDLLFSLDMSGTYRCEFEAVKKTENRVTVRAVSSSLVVRDGATKVIGRIM